MLERQLFTGNLGLAVAEIVVRVLILTLGFIIVQATRWICNHTVQKYSYLRKQIHLLLTNNMNPWLVPSLETSSVGNI